jgi:hypothetical protein
MTRRSRSPESGADEAQDESRSRELPGARWAGSVESGSESGSESELESHRRALDELVVRALEARAEIVALVKRERGAKVSQLRALQRFEAKGYHHALCIAIDDFAVQVGVTRSKREAQDLLRMAKRLQHAPRVDAAFGAGGIDWTKIRDVGPVLTAETEDVWLPRLMTWTNAQLLARMRKDRHQPPVRRLAFAVDPTIGALYDKLAVDVRRRADRPLDEDEVFAEILRRALSAGERELDADAARKADVPMQADAGREADAGPQADAQPEADAGPPADARQPADARPAAVAAEKDAVVAARKGEALAAKVADGIAGSAVIASEQLSPPTTVVLHRGEDFKRTTSGVVFLRRDGGELAERSTPPPTGQTELPATAPSYPTWARRSSRVA